MNKTQFIIKTEEIYNSFKDEIETIRHVGKIDVGPPNLKMVAVCAYAKCYDFVIYILSLDKLQNAFFQLPMLRGLCEDLISISYLLDLSPEESNLILMSEQLRKERDMIESQKEYFKKYNPGQIVVSKEIYPTIPEYKTLVGMDKEGERYLPKPIRMSKKVGLKDLYDFLYNATSKTVHFDVGTLLGMGWGNYDKTENKIDINFSFKHNYHQYYDFVLFYSSLIFHKQTLRFKKAISSCDGILNKLTPLINDYEKIDWPTFISFSQLNIKQPSVFQRLTYRVMSKYRK